MFHITDHWKTRVGLFTFLNVGARSAAEGDSFFQRNRCILLLFLFLRKGAVIFSDIKLDCASILDRKIVLRVLLKSSLVLNIEIGVGLMFRLSTSFSRLN